MATSDEDHIPVRDSNSSHPRYTPPEQMYWLSNMKPDELREKYITQRDDFFTLKKFSVRQEDKIKKLQTKLRKVISDRKKDGDGGYAQLKVKEVEHQDAIESYQQTIRQLRLRNVNLEKKVKLANVQLTAAKKNRPLLFRDVGSRTDSGLKKIRSPSAGPQSSRRTISPSRPSSSPSKMFISEEESPMPSPVHIQNPNPMFPERIREVLSEARERIVNLEGEKRDLQEQVTEAQQNAEDTEYELQQKIVSLEEDLKRLQEEVHTRGIREERDSVAVVRAQREVRNLSAKSQTLQEQVSNIEDALRIEKSSKEKLEIELEHVGTQLENYEDQIKELQKDNKKYLSQLTEASEKQEMIKRERDQVSKENERLAALTLSVDQRREGHTNQVQQLKLQIAQLEAALQSDLSERGTFIENITKDKEELVRAEMQIKKLQAENLNLLEKSEKVEKKLTILSKAGVMNLADTEGVKISRQQEAATDEELARKELEIQVQKLQQQLSELQLLYRERSNDLENTSRIISEHANTYKALENQIKQVKLTSHEKECELNATIKGLQETLQRREQRANKLEKQLLAVTDKSVRERIENSQEQLSQTVHLGRHDNVLEFHIDRMKFICPEFHSLKTFVSWTMPISLDDPLQHTNLAVGETATYNHSTLYKINMNYMTLQSLKDDVITVCVYILLDSGHPFKVGECQISLGEVLQHPRNTLHNALPVKCSLDDTDDLHSIPDFIMKNINQESIGALSYWFRLQRPCEEIIAKHLHRIGLLEAGPSREESQIPFEASSMLKSSNPIPRSRSVEERALTVISHTSKSMLTNLQHTALDSIDTETQTSLSNDNSKKCSKSNTNKHTESPKKGKIKDRKQNKKSAEKNNDTGEHNAKAFFSKSSSQNSNILGEANDRPGSSLSNKTFTAGSPTRSNSVHDTVMQDPAEQQSCSESDSISQQNSIIGLPLDHSKSKSLSSKSKTLSSKEDDEIDDKSSVESVVNLHPSAHIPRPTSGVFKKRRPVTAVKPNSRIMSVSGKDQDQSQSDDSGSEESGDKSSSDQSDTQFEESHTSDSQDSKMWKEREEPRSSDSSEDDNEKTNTITNVSSANKKFPIQRVKSLGESKNSSGSFITEPSDSEGVVSKVHRKSKKKRHSIYIEIVCLKLLDGTTVSNDPTIHFLFVDYHGFLGLPPEQLETPQSLPKPPPGQNLYFNFGQELNVDKTQYPQRYKAFCELLKNRGIIKFTVTSEPPEDLQDTEDCRDLGYAYVNLPDMKSAGQDLVETQLPVKAADDGQKIAILTVTVKIKHALQQP